jgi:hypothetical protein
MIPGRQFIVRLFGLGLVGGMLTAWCSLGGCCAVERGEANPLLFRAVSAESVSSENGGGGPGDATAGPHGVELESRPLPRIPAGTAIGKGAPAGWSNFLMIAVPTLTEQDERDAPKIAAHYARMFKFTLLAKTEKLGGSHSLKAVARGFTMTVRGKEVIVDPKNTFGADMGMFGRRILDENEKHIDADLRQVARTANLSLFDATKAVMRRGADHVHMVMRHAVVIDPSSGAAYTFIWLLSRQRDGYALAEKQLQLIPEGTREARYLSVKRDKFVLGMPTPEAFALVRTPQGKPIAWTPELAKVAAVKHFRGEQVAMLEKLLLAAGRSAAETR